MSAHKVLRDVFLAPLLPDPGASGTIRVGDQSPVCCNLVSATTETRTLAAPSRAGAIISIGMKTDGGDITLTVTGGYDEAGSTTIVFSDPGQFAVLHAFDVSGTITWRLIATHLTGGPASQTWVTGAGAGITGGTGTIYKNSASRSGTIFYASILLDLTGLGSSTTDLDIIGVGTSPAYLGQVTTAQMGTTILVVSMTCLEAPATGVTDIDLYSATEATGKFDDAVTGLTETALITAGGAWTNGAIKSATVVPAANEYLYITCGAAGVPGTYTAGKFLIEIYGY